MTITVTVIECIVLVIRTNNVSIIMSITSIHSIRNVRNFSNISTNKSIRSIAFRRMFLGGISMWNF